MEKKYELAAVKPRIQEFLDLILTDAAIELDFAIVEGEVRHSDFENPDVLVRFSGPDVDLLLSNKGELLLALEQLTMEALRMPLEDHSRLCFDANDYRMLRIEELRVSALAAADRVKRSHTPFHFNPMNSRERRIIHLALRNETAVRSESAGLGPLRQVVVYPADMPTPPDADAQVFVPARSDGGRRPGRRPPRRRF
jgi:spoIIIJ-associated protein